MIIFSISFIIVYFQFVYCYLFGLELSSRVIELLASAYINYSIALAALAYSSFILGYSMFIKSSQQINIYKAQPFYSNYFIKQMINNLLPFYIISLLFFYVFVNKDFLFYGYYDGGNSWGSSASGISTLCHTVVCILVTLETWRLQWNRPISLFSYLSAFDKRILIISLIWILPFFLAGDRAIYLSIIFYYIASYAIIVRPFKLMESLFLLFLISVVCVFFAVIRQSDEVGVNRLSESVAKSREEIGFQLNRWPTMELANSYRCWNFAISLAENDNALPENHYFGKYNLVWSSVYLVPFINRIYDPFGAIEFRSPPEFLTYRYQGTLEYAGIGSASLVAPYLDFGLWGMIIIPIIYGTGFAIIENRFRQKNSVYGLFTFLNCVYWAIYVNRSEFYLVFKSCVWGCGLIFFLLLITSKTQNDFKRHL